jgi:hypothetical protein
MTKKPYSYPGSSGNFMEVSNLNESGQSTRSLIFSSSGIRTPFYIKLLPNKTETEKAERTILIQGGTIITRLNAMDPDTICILINPQHPQKLNKNYSRFADRIIDVKYIDDCKTQCGLLDIDTYRYQSQHQTQKQTSPPRKLIPSSSLHRLKIAANQ